MMQPIEQQSAPQLYLITRHFSITDANSTSDQAQILLSICQARPIAAVLMRFEAGAFPTLETSKNLKTIISALQETGSAVLIEITQQSLLPQDGVQLVYYMGADGVHLSIANQDASTSGAMSVEGWRKACGSQLIVGAGLLRARHDAMEAGEKGADYLLFGEENSSGQASLLSAVTERTQWWASLFSVPCVAYAPTLDTINAIASTRCEFIALGDALWNAPEGAQAAFKKVCAILSQVLV